MAGRAGGLRIRTRGRLLSRVALVTGGSRGIGRATALALAQEGAKVVVNYVRGESAADEVVRTIRRGGGDSVALRGDVSNSTDVRELVAEAKRRYGDIEILVNNAGIISRENALESQIDDFDTLWKVNTRGALQCVLEVAPGMVRGRYGRIVNLSSVFGVGGGGGGRATFYAITKGAIVTMTKWLAQELGPYGVTVNAVAPGFIRTDMTMESGPAKFREWEKSISGRTALRRIGEAEEVASVILFLVSDDASFVTGQVLTVDGGRADFLSTSA